MGLRLWVHHFWCLVEGKENRNPEIQADMTSVTPAQEIQEETKCSICLDYMKEPVNVECGHNFCRVCITNYCEAGGKGDYEPLCCPNCRAWIQKRTLRTEVGKLRPAGHIRPVQPLSSRLLPCCPPPLQSQSDVTLDPDTAHPRLVLSEDGKSVRWEDTRQHVPDNPKRFDSSRCVLGLEGFSSGRHYWEVEVEDGGAWAVGVARESVRRKGRVNVNPEEGIWAVGQCGTQYLALTSPKIPLSLGERPRTIGIYLDCEEGRVAFFDADNEAPIFTFPPASVPGEKILPLLCLGRGSQFRLCPCITGYNIEP
uniref:Uncharacterized protein n=1 Tax=Terrapene triunguis TaxID=2587831 RepID=A0A674IY19_9SAUR